METVESPIEEKRVHGAVLRLVCCIVITIHFKYMDTFAGVPIQLLYCQWTLVYTSNDRDTLGGAHLLLGT